MPGRGTPATDAPLTQLPARAARTESWSAVPAALALAAAASSPPSRGADGSDRLDGSSGWAPVAGTPADGAWPECACHVCVPQHDDPDGERVPGAERFRWWPDWRTAAAAVVLLALVAGGIALRSASAPRGEPVAIPQPAASPTPTPDTATDVVVHVAGAVTAPGVVRLPLGSRVSDALDAVGGAGPEADLGAVNLARTVTDGEQVVVPVVGAPPVAGAAAAPPGDGLVDLNVADVATLETLPGVGPVLAARIVQHRGERPFSTVDELDEVPGIGPALMADLRPLVRV